MAGLSILAQGTEPVGAVFGSFCTAQEGFLDLTTREGLDLRVPGPPRTERRYVPGNGTTLIRVPVGDENPVRADILLDAQHRPCGYIIGGGVETLSWSQRILPGETGRVSAQALLAALGSVPADDRPEVVRRTSGFLGRRKEQPLGYVVDLDFYSAWTLVVEDAQEALAAGDALTAGGMRDLLVDPLYRAGPDLAIELDTAVSEGRPSWLVEVDTAGGHLRLVVAEMSLPDS